MSENASQQPDEPAEEISLDELSQAYAQVMSGESAYGAQIDTESLRLAETAADDRPEPPADQADDQAEAEKPEAEPDDVDEKEEEEHHCEVCPRTILEAMLFVGNQEGEPLSATKAAELMRGVEPGEIIDLIDGLNRRYTANGCPYEIIGEGSGYRLALRKAYYPLRNRFYGRIREARLSQAAIDTLAIVAYQQPLTTEQVGHLRGKPSGHVLSQLVHRGLLRIERKRAEGKQRRVAHYFTTDRFLEVFGLEELEDLPQTEETSRWQDPGLGLRH